MNLNLFEIAHAEGGETVAVESTATASEAHSSGGISIDPMVVGYNVLNVVILLFILKIILYKPLTKLLQERERHIKKGVEDAENAKILLKESESSREKMLKEARAEGQSMVESARKTGEQVRTDILAKAQDEAQRFISAGQEMVESEKAKALQEVRTQAVDLVVKAAEKLLKSKLDADKDAQLIKESIESFAQ